MPETKICSKCHKKQPITSFPKRPNRKAGLHGHCYECRRKSTHNWYLRNKQLCGHCNACLAWYENKRVIVENYLRYRGSEKGFWAAEKRRDIRLHRFPFFKAQVVVRTATCVLLKRGEKNAKFATFIFGALQRRFKVRRHVWLVRRIRYGPYRR